VHCSGLFVGAGEVHDLGHFGFGDFIGEDAANSHTAAMDMQHDIGGFLTVFIEEAFQNMDDEFHRRVIIVQQQNLVHIRFARLWPWFKQ